MNGAPVSVARRRAISVFSHAGRADHHDVFRDDRTCEIFGELLAAPAVADGDGHGALGGGLADDVLVELGDDFLGGQVDGGHAGNSSFYLCGAPCRLGSLHYKTRAGLRQTHQYTPVGAGPKARESDASGGVMFMRILYIDIDSLRADHLGCYGYHRKTSPAIDAIAAEGVRFNQCYTPDAPCLPSRTAFYSGRFGIHTGVVGHGGTAAEPKTQGPGRGFVDSFIEQGLARQLQKLGFHTAMISPFGQRHGAHWFYAGVP